MKKLIVFFKQLFCKHTWAWSGGKIPDSDEKTYICKNCKKESIF